MSNPLSILANPDLHTGAMRRVEQWYRVGQSAPQPEWADFLLNQDERLLLLGKELSEGSYTPRPMPLLPYPKSKQRLRHFCEPSVKDQLAFTIYATALAPLLEHGMKNLSFGNRWYRGITWNEDSSHGRWEPMRWSLADSQMYQPYRRGHGLFRRVASWTVDAMLGASDIGSAGKHVTQESYDASSIPRFAKQSSWSAPHCKKVFWARFDLKLAFPSVRLDTLRTRLKAFVSNLTNPPGRDLRKQFSLNSPQDPLVKSLQLYPSEIVSVLLAGEACLTLWNHLIDCLEKVRYVGFQDADRLFFGDNTDHSFRLPTADRPDHVGLPTGLAISPLLLNVYLHSLDDRMHQWCRGGHGGFLRFADDMILLAPSADKLAEGIDSILEELKILDIEQSDLNLRINEDKIEPTSVKDLVKDVLRVTDKGKKNTARHLQQGSGHLAALSKQALTVELRNPFVTNLVERMSELGSDDELDALPDRAKERINRLAEMVYLEPKADAVPRATQVVFAANHLVRGWLSEESLEQDRRELREIRQVIATALRTAPEKPRLWRAVIRAALRRPIDKRTEDQRTSDDKEAAKWFMSIAIHFGQDSDGTWHSEEPSETQDSIWPLFTSYHRHEVWRTLAATAKELHASIARYKHDIPSFPNSHSWLFRAGDETDLGNSPGWLEEIALKLAAEWYPVGKANLHLHQWEIQSLALCALAFTPRAIIASSKAVNKPGESFASIVAQHVRDGHVSKWSSVADLLAFRHSRNLEKPTTRSARFILAATTPGDEAAVLDALHLKLKRKALLRLAETVSLDSSENPHLVKAAEDEMKEYISSTPKNRGWLATRDYSRARRIFQNQGGALW